MAWGTNLAAKALLLLLLAATSACATKPKDPEALTAYRQLNDPLEPLNRGVFAFNMTVDRFFMRPVAKGYHWITPAPVRTSLRNALNNLENPWTFVNDLGQGKFDRAGTTLARFIINSTVGIAGLFDPAQGMGLAPHKEDFGQTLAVWGFGEGPYLVLPFFGPSNPRDGVGLAGEFFGDPTSIAIDQSNVEGLKYIYFGAQAIDAREAVLDSLDQLRDESQDFYAALRSAYRQNRKFEISDGALDTSDDDGLFDDQE